MEQTQYCLVLVTCPDQDTAERIASRLVSARLAACVNILSGMKSIYHWQGEVEEDQEVLLVVKTKVELVDPALISLVSKLHPYQVPEVLALPVIAGSADYLAWLEKETNS